MTLLLVLFLQLSFAQVEDDLDDVLTQIDQLHPPIVNKGPEIMDSAPGCEKLDLRPKLPPARHQDTVGWCWGALAADLYSFRTGKNISMIDISLNYARSLDDPLLPGTADFMQRPEAYYSRLIEKGNPFAAMQEMSKNGFCLEENLPARDFELAEKFSSLKENFETIEKLRGKYQKILNDQGLDAAKKMCQDSLGTVRQVFPKAKFDDVLKILSAPSAHHIFDKLSEQTCNPRFKLDKPLEPQVENIEKLNAAEKIKKMDALLDRKEPVGIGFDPLVMGRPRGGSNKYLHTASIVGRRWNKEASRCEFLLRNSYGKSCHQPMMTYGHECRDGHLWIPQDQMANASSDLFYIK